MGTVIFDVPDDRPVQILIGDGSLGFAADRTRLPGEPMALPRRRRAWLTALGGAAVLAFGFVLGQHTLTSHAEAEAKAATAVNAAPPPVEQAFPDHALPSPNRAASSPPPVGKVPAALTQQLAKPPKVVPAPGQPQAAAKPAKNPFGLGD
ncbi:MAG: hypothetical protein J0H57_01640 [Rhodospirillales bacterium]|nr:hypothetical protein [Rhodospirillales bacterium]